MYNVQNIHCTKYTLYKIYIVQNIHCTYESFFHLTEHVAYLCFFFKLICIYMYVTLISVGA